MNDKKLLISEGVKKYFQTLIDNQTNELKKSISELQGQKNEQELEALKLQLYNEKVMRSNAQASALENEKLLDSVNARITELEKQMNALRNEKADLEEVLLSKDKTIAGLELQKEKIIQENINELQTKDNKIKSLSKSTKRLETELKTYKGKYSELDEAFEKYQVLSQETKSRLHNIFESDSIYGMIGACSDWKNITGFWDFVKRRIVEKDKNDEVDDLVCLFEFLLNAYNAKKGVIKYELIKPMQGEKFDSDEHMILGTQTDGLVSAVRLAGILEVENGSVIQKALIEV